MTDDSAKPTETDLLFDEIQKLHSGLQRMKSKSIVSGHDIQQALLPTVAALLQLRDAIRQLEGKLET